MRRFKLWISFILLMDVTNLQAQKVALVLSGGGAKGIAHVGVLKVLEEYEIPVDYIIGTSMGAVVGGFYAAGYSADHIEEIIRSENFLSWVNGQVTENFNYYYTSAETNASWINFRLALDSTLNASFNSNLARDMSLNFALTEMLAQPSQASRYNFDSLLIPFRAIAADIFTQQEQVLHSGSLNEAIRASMTVPLFYRPIRLDGKLLFDGGIYNNFPVDVAQKTFDPDIIIGVNVSSKVFHEYPYEQDEALINQSLLFMILDKSDPSLLGDNGIYIEPNLETYSGFDFAKAREIIDSGYVAALAALPEIRQKIKRRISCDQLAEKRNQFLLKMEPLRFNNIIFRGFNIPQISYVKSLFNIDNDYLSISDIKSGYYKLVSEDYFKDIYPNITYNQETGGYDFEISAQPERSLNLEVGGNIATRSISEVFLGINFHNFNGLLLEHNLNFYTGRFYQSALLQSRINFPGRNQFYLKPRFLANKWDFVNSQDLLGIEDKPSVFLERIDRSLGLDVGLPVGLKYKMVFHGSYFTNKDNFSNDPNFNSNDTLDVLNFRGFRYGASLSKNTLNRKQYPSWGTNFHISLDYIDGNETYHPGNTSQMAEQQEHSREWIRLKFQMERYLLKLNNYRGGYLIDGVISNQPMFSNFMATLINAPSFNPLQDSKTLFIPNFRSHSFLGLGWKNIFLINNNLDFRLEGYAFKPYRKIEESVSEKQFPVYQDFDHTVHWAGTAGFVYHSPLGPISFSANYYDDETRRFGFLLHLGYLLFNNRSLE
ncbi:MAG: patatin-like phospholipase family protein [Candidatus Cyclobacteriaceae bacterium M3_2C_046]